MVLDTTIRVYVSLDMKQKITLTIQDDLIEKMKLKAVLDKRSVSDITEELYQKWLGTEVNVKIKKKSK
jgi:predicted CopG family antitoxin